MPRAEMRRKGVEDFPPDPLNYTKYLNNLSTNRRAASYKISRTESESSLAIKTGAHRYQPGQYKVDRNFVEDKTREVRAGVVTDSASSPSWSLSQLDTREDEHGVLRGIRNPGNMRNWFNPTAPGQYQHIDGMEHAARSVKLSAPAFSVRKGEPAETVREKKQALSNPGPGHYELNSKFDTIRKKREETPKRHSKVCRWEGQFQHMFRCMQPNPGGQPRKVLHEV